MRRHPAGILRAAQLHEVAECFDGSQRIFVFALDREKYMGYKEGNDTDKIIECVPFQPRPLDWNKKRHKEFPPCPQLRFKSTSATPGRSAKPTQ